MTRSFDWRLALTATLVLACLGCGGRRARRQIDRTEDALQAKLSQALASMQAADTAGLRREGEELSGLRLQAGSMRIPEPYRAARDTLLLALDAVVDGVTAATLGIRESAQGQGAGAGQ